MNTHLIFFLIWIKHEGLGFVGREVLKPFSMNFSPKPFVLRLSDPRAFGPMLNFASFPPGMCGKTQTQQVTKLSLFSKHEKQVMRKLQIILQSKQNMFTIQFSMRRGHVLVMGYAMVEMVSIC